MDVADLVSELGGHPRSDEGENLQILANEILILREKLTQAEEAEGRCERKLGRELEARKQAERRADLAESAISRIDGVIGETKRRALAEGAPLEHVKDERRVVEAGHSVL